MSVTETLRSLGKWFDSEWRPLVVVLLHIHDDDVKDAHASMQVILFEMDVSSFVCNWSVYEASVWGLRLLTKLPYLMSYVWGLVASLCKQSRSYSGQRQWIQSSKFPDKADRYGFTFCNVYCANHWHKSLAMKETESCWTESTHSEKKR